MIVIVGIQQKLNVESGIDSFVTEAFRDASDKDYFDRNFGTGKLFPCMWSCLYIPWLGYSLYGEVDS